MPREIKCLGIHPFSFQRDVIVEATSAPGTKKTIVVKSRRQVGKSLLISNLLLWYGCNIPKSKNYCVSPTIKQAKKIFKSIVDAITPGKIIKRKNATDLIIELINGSSIIFRSAEQRESLRGETCTGILCIDESAYIPDEIYDIIKPWTDFHKAITVMFSTPFIKSGFFYKYWCYGLDGLNNCVSIDWCDSKYQDDLDKILPPEQLDEYRQTLPTNVFKSEYLGEFLDDDGMVFQLRDCWVKKEIFPGDKLYFGIDWSNQGENDDTVLTAFNQNGEMVFLRYWNNLTPLGQVDTIFQQLELYKKQIEAISCETNSIGTPYTDLLKGKSQLMKSKVSGFETTNTSKNDIVVQMQVALEQGKVKLMADEKLKRQFGYFTANYNPKTRNVSYSAPDGLHDDIVMASMIAYDAYKNKSTRGVYKMAFNTRDKYDKGNKWHHDRS